MSSILSCWRRRSSSIAFQRTGSTSAIVSSASPLAGEMVMVADSFPAAPGPLHRAGASAAYLPTNEEVPDDRRVAGRGRGRRTRDAGGRDRPPPGGVPHTPPSPGEGWAGGRGP